MGTLRAHPHCACLFDDVPVLFWPILWWQLNDMICWMRGASVSGARFETKAWGFITLRYVVCQPGPNAYRPVERTFRALSDPVWETSLPANLAWQAFLPSDVRVVPGARGTWSEGPEGAIAPIPNTS